MNAIIIAIFITLTGSAAYAANDCDPKLSPCAPAQNKIDTKIIQDERVVIDRMAAEYRQLNAIGVVTLPAMKSYGTGFLIDACYFLTNKHVVFGKAGKPKIHAKVSFSVGQSREAKQPFTHILVDGEVIRAGNFDGTVSSEYTDWVVVRLATSIGNIVGFFSMYQMDMKKMVDRSVITAGYPGSKTQNGKDLSKMYGDVNCKIFGFSIFGFAFHTCQTTLGQSGSPVLAKGNDGKYYAIAMISGDKDLSSLDLAFSA